MKKITAVAAIVLLSFCVSAQSAEHKRDSVVQRAKIASGIQTTKAKVNPASKTVGVIEYTRGPATLQGKSKQPQVAGRGVKFGRNDIITTGKKSFAILRLTDGTRMTLRPNSKFAVEEFNPSPTKNASATLRLFKGGMRTVTGFISKYNRNGYKMRTPVATIGIRGTEFDARLCDAEDCEADRKKLKKVDLAKPKAVGRVAFMRGKMAARNKDGSERKVRRGEPIYEGDTLVSGKGSFGVIAFRDKSRITLQPRSQFHVEKFSFSENKPESNVALMSLLRGGLRAVTGQIGKVNRNQYRMRTPVATIGIRGTGYDLQCQGGCVALDGAYYAPNEPTLVDRILDLVSSPAHADVPASDGLFAAVWSGSIQIQQASGTTQLFKGQFAFVPDPNNPAQLLDLPEVPLFIQNNTAPRPDQVEINEDKLFSELEQDSAKPGLYVSVYEGLVTMEGADDGQVVDIAPGEAAFSGDGEVVVRLTEQPVFHPLDWVPNPADVPDNVDALDEPADDGYTCEIVY